MKLLLFSDIHVHNHNQYAEILPSGRNSRLQDCLNIIYQITDLIDKEKVDKVICLGDLFHSRTKLDIDVFSSTFEAMRTLSQKIGKGNFFILKGNHDSYTKVGGIHSLEAFNEIAQVRAGDPSIELLTVNPWPSDLAEQISVAFYPWTADTEGMKNWFQQMPPVDILLIHQGVSEAVVGPYDVKVKTEISLKDLPLDRIKLCIAGDYHKRQFLAGGKLHYIGSPLQLSFGERGDDKCFSLIYTSDWSVKSILTNAPKFYEYASKEEFDLRDSSVDVSKDFVRITAKSVADIESLKKEFPRIQTVLEEKETAVVSRSEGLNLSDDKALLTSWMKSQDETDLEYLEMGMALLQQCE